MSFNWEHYYFLAEELAGRTSAVEASSEARFRAAISRAYYSAYIRARNRRRCIVNDPSDGTSHEAVINWYRERPTADEKRVGNRLRQLKEYRKRADYHDEFPQLLWVKDTALGTAKDVHSILARI